MNRIDELTARLIDSVLTDDEARELAALTSAEPTALSDHLALLNVEAALRGLRTNLDLGAAVVRSIETERAGRTAANVLAEIADRPPPAWRSHRRSRWVRPGLVAASLAAMFVIIWLAFPAPEQVAPSPELARLRTISGIVEVSGIETDGADRFVSPGQTVQTVGADSVAVLEFPDQTSLELNADTEVRLTSIGDGESPRKLQLVHGQVSVVVTGRRTVLGGGTAEVTAQNGSFSAWASGADSLRVESKEGDVQVARAAMPNTLALGPGRAAFIRDELTPIRVEPPFEVISTPRATLDFRGALDVAFAADGQTVWAASAKQRARWRPFDGTTERLPFDPPFKNDGVVARLTADGQSVIVCGVDDGEDRTIVRDLVSGAARRAFPIRVSEPRFVCSSADAAWVATIGPKPNLRVRVWDFASGKERFARDLPEVPYSLAATPNGRYLAIDIANLRRSKDNRVDFLDSSTGDVAFSLPTAQRTVTAIAFSADGRQMIAGLNGAVQIWDVPERRLVRTIEGFGRGITQVAFNASASMVAAGTQDGQVWIWSTVTGRRVQVLDTGSRGVRAIAFSPDGKFLISATNRAPVALWDVLPEPAIDPDL